MNPSPAAPSRRPGKLWLVIPSYNDTARLARFLPSLCAVLECLPFRTEVQVVDDGSRAEARAALEELTAQTRLHYGFVRPAIFLDRNEGKGSAVLRGWDASEGAEWLGFVDADGAVPAGEVGRVAERLANGPRRAALFASRIRMRGRTVARSLRRHLSGRLFASLVGSWIDSRVYDSQCGFKLIPEPAYQKIRPHLREKGFAFDVELLALLNHFKTPVEEVPVDWSDIPGSKVSLAGDSWRMLRAVWRIRGRVRALAKTGSK